MTVGPGLVHLNAVRILPDSLAACNRTAACLHFEGTSTMLNQNTTIAGLTAQCFAALASNGHPPNDSLPAILYHLFCKGATVADAPRRALRKHQGVQSWHDVSGAVGRLSDTVNTLRRWLELHQPSQRIASATIALKAAGRTTRVHVFWLEQSIPVASLQLPLFAEGGVE